MDKYTKKRIQDLYFGGYTVKSIVKTMTDELNNRVEADQKYKKSEVLALVEAVLIKLKRE